MAGQFRKFWKKASASVSTTESWLALLLLFWGFAGAAMTAAIVKVWQSALSVGWEYYVIVGIPTAILLAMTLRYCTWWWAKHKASAPITVAPANQTDSPNDGEASSSVMVEMEKLGRSQFEALKSHSDLTDRRFETIENDVLSKIQEMLSKAKSDNKMEIEQTIEDNKASFARKFGHLKYILEAKTGLYYLTEMGASLDLMAVDLDKLPPVKGFKQKHAAWISQVERWKQVVDRFGDSLGLKDPISYESALLSKSNWSEAVNGIEDDDLKLAVKEYRLMADRLVDARKVAEMHLSSRAYSAFNGQSELPDRYIQAFLD